MTLYLDQLRNNLNAKISIDPGDMNYVIDAFVISDTGLSGSNQWDSALDGILGAGKVADAKSTLDRLGRTASLAASAAGVPFANRVLSAGDSVVAWTGSSRFAFSLDLLFLALNESDNPVNEMAKCFRYVEPDGNPDFVLTAPLGYQPSLTGNSPGCVSIKIGNWFQTPRIFVVRALNVVVAQRTDPQGVPLYVQATFQFESSRLLNYTEVRAMFPNLRSITPPPPVNNGGSPG